MITPAYAPTATERVLPRMALDFTTGVLDPRVTVTRALNTATRVNASGLIEIVNANLPRFDYNPSTLAAKGLLIEESRANLLTYSEQFDNPAWTKSGVVISADTTAAPDGTQTSDTFTDTTANTGHLAFESVSTITSGTTYTLSVFAKASSATVIQVLGRSGTMGLNVWANFNLSNGTIGSVGSSTTASITDFGGGWYRCIVTGTATGTGTGAFALSLTNNSTTALRSPTYIGTGTGTFIWGAQIEAGAFATSYIPTTTTSLTRNADVVTMTGTNFSSWYNASEGAFVFWGDQNAVSAEIGYFAEARTDNSNRMQMFANNGGGQNQLTVRNSGSIQADFTNSGTITQGTAFKTSFAYKLDSFGLARNGGTVATDTLGTIPSVTDLLIGHSGAASNLQLNGHIAKILYYPQRIINAEVQAFSK